MFDPVSFEDIGSLAVTSRLDVGITLIFHGLHYAEGRRHFIKAGDKTIESTQEKIQLNSSGSWSCSY